MEALLIIIVVVGVSLVAKNVFINITDVNR